MTRPAPAVVLPEQRDRAQRRRHVAAAAYRNTKSLGSITTAFENVMVSWVGKKPPPWDSCQCVASIWENEFCVGKPENPSRSPAPAPLPSKSVITSWLADPG